MLEYRKIGAPDLVCYSYIRFRKGRTRYCRCLIQRISSGKCKYEYAQHKKQQVPEIKFGVVLGGAIDDDDNKAVGYAGNE